MSKCAGYHFLLFSRSYVEPMNTITKAVPGAGAPWLHTLLCFFTLLHSIVLLYTNFKRVLSIARTNSLTERCSALYAVAYKERAKVLG